jgi:serine/threonine-protein kinase
MTLDESSRIPVLPGEMLAGTYRIERVLGEGGMGVVLLGRHLRLDKPVAIKLLRKEAVRALGAPRFVQEARIAAKLKGEHVARVFDVDEVDGTPYLVMEYLEGETLAAELDSQGPFSIERAVDAVLQACEALAEAHTLGIVHRDVKLENLFFARMPDGASRVKLLDFGVSKILGADSLTRTAALVGSPVYMAPEQLESSKDVDARADIWSIGVVLFELLTNTQPFQGESLPQLCVAIREHATPSLSELRNDVPVELDRVIQRCLAKKRQDRYRTIAELAAELAPFASESGRGSVESARRMARASAATIDFSDSDTVAAPIITNDSTRRAPSGSVAASVSIAKPEVARGRQLVLIGIGVCVAAALALGLARFRTTPAPELARISIPAAPKPAVSPPETTTRETPAPVVTATVSVAASMEPRPTQPPAPRRESVRRNEKRTERPAATAVTATIPSPDPLSDPH